LRTSSGKFYRYARFVSRLNGTSSITSQAYGYNYLPLLLSLSSPPLSILLPNPLPASTPASVAASKYPYTALRKSLRLLIEDPDPLEELENDISYVYSGYAPISVRLVQCVAQKGGVLSNPAGEKDKKIAGDDTAAGKTKDGINQKVQAHPIVGWKGFEDVVTSIPGETTDIVQKAPGTQDGAGPSVATLCKCSISATICRPGNTDSACASAGEGATDNDCGVLPGRVHVHGDRRTAVGRKAECWYVVVVVIIVAGEC
jgi:hypothetical protein